MSSGYVGGPSRSAWEGAAFYQRMNPGTMTHVPSTGDIAKSMGHGDPLAEYVDRLESGAFATPVHEHCTCREAKAWRQLKAREAAKMRRWRNKRRPGDAIPF